MSTMSYVSFRVIESFLRARGALRVLEGAPYYWPRREDKLRAVHPGWLEQAAPLLDEGDGDDDVLYLGSGDVCPAAEGWAARVLGLSANVAAHELPFVRLFVYDRDISVRESEDMLWMWSWSGWAGGGVGDRETVLPGTEPPTPAERLAAVLNYELGRVR